MEQNLSEKERKQRLAIGLILIGASGAVHYVSGDLLLSLVLLIGSLGFIANYFTCFCGTKKLIKSLKNRA